MAAGGNEETVECGFCLSRNEALRSPKVLPCGHVHCLECLQQLFDINRVVQCPLPSCRGVCDWNNFSAWKSSKDLKIIFCDVCSKKNSNTKSPAVSFCMSCDTKLCPNHVKWHDEGFDHPKITIEDYRTQARESEDRNCRQHDQQAYVTGCKICRKVMCLQCIYEMGICVGGQQHKLISLSDLAADVKQKLEALKEEMITKEAEVAKEFKDTTKKVSDLDEETEKNLQLLHRTRDVQLKALATKYALLEREYLESRQLPKFEATEYLEGVIGVRWTELRNEILKMDARLKRTQQVEIISAYPEMSENIKKVINNSVPEMIVKKSPTLVPAGENRDIELKMDAVTANINGCQADTTSSKKSVVPTVSPLPWSLEAMRVIKTPGKPRSVCFDQEIIYIALDEKCIITAGVDQGARFWPKTSFSSYINSFASHDGKLYVLVDGEPSEILVLACATLKIVKKWTHTDVPSKWNGISVCSRGVAACDRLNSCVIIYSHVGLEMARIALPHLVTGWVAACFFGPDAIIVSHHDNSELLMLEVDTGEVAWTCYLNFEPLGVTCYGDDWVLAAGYECTNMAVINSSTGALVHEIQQGLPRGKVFGLATGSDDRLIAADFDAGEVVSFKIKLK